jgi:hypothetical protein
MKLWIFVWLIDISCRDGSCASLQPWSCPARYGVPFVAIAFCAIPNEAAAIITKAAAIANFVSMFSPIEKYIDS